MKNKIMVCLLLIIVVGCFFVPIKNMNAENNNYSIDYLLRHYNAVTFGTKDNNILNVYRQTIQGTNKGDIKNLNIEGQVLARGEYANKVNENVDFDKMYAQVMYESQELVNDTQYHINDYYINVDKPGIYMINNTAKGNDYEYYYSDLNSYRSIRVNKIKINNYQPDHYYIFNIMDSMSTNDYQVEFLENGASTPIPFEEYKSSEKYSGNIIFNYPNARYVSANMINGTIIAPKADVYLNSEYIYDNEWVNGTTVLTKDVCFVGTILSNSITHVGQLSLEKSFNNVSEGLLSEIGKQYISEDEDYTDDIYYGDYALTTLLQNYSIVSLGQKDYQQNTKFSTINYPNGSTNIFHITSQFLINGNLGVEGEQYPGFSNGWGKITPNFIRIDLDSNLITDSYLNGNVMSGEYNSRYNYYDSRYYIKYWDINSDRRGSKNHMFSHSDNYQEGSFYNDGAIFIPDNYLNFNRLYSNIIQEQSAIEEGKKAKVGEDNVVHIPIGGNYVIDDISKVKEIMFDNFAENKDKITIVTIKNEGSINFPLISKDTGDYKGIPTNDYYGKNVANQEYEMSGLLPDEYHGNIIFNVPNANYIKLTPNAPFAGHLIAPNADVETEETQLAGCMIVNSLYAEGGSEAHFYPITAKLDCDCAEYHNLSEDMKLKFSEFKLKKLLGGDTSTIETNIIGDEVQYKNDISTLEHVLSKCPSSNASTNPIVNILKNPPTSSTIGIILLILVILGIRMVYYKKKKSNNTN